MPKVVIFDFDGVIHDSFEFHRQKIAEFTGTLLSESDFRDIHNGNFFENKNNKLNGIDWPSYRNFIYDTQHKLPIKNNVKKLLQELSSKHDLLIVTSGGKQNISDCLEYNGALHLFKEVFGLESHKSKIDKFKLIFEKYSITPAECVFITDTLGDILEANHVGIKTIAVDFGYHSRETLEKGNPFKIISNIEEIKDCVILF